MEIEKSCNELTLLSWNLQRLGEASTMEKKLFFKEKTKKLIEDYQPHIIFFCEVSTGFERDVETEYSDVFRGYRGEFIGNANKVGGISPCSYYIFRRKDVEISRIGYGIDLKRQYIEANTTLTDGLHQSKTYVIGLVHALAGWGEELKKEQLTTNLTNILASKESKYKVLIGDINIDARKLDWKGEISAYCEGMKPTFSTKPTWKRRDELKVKEWEAVLDYVIHTENLKCKIYEEVLEEYMNENGWNKIDHAPLVSTLSIK